MTSKIRMLWFGLLFGFATAAVAALPGVFGADDTVLVKGSRSAGMERILQALLASPAAGEG